MVEPADTHHLFRAQPPQRLAREAAPSRVEIGWINVTAPTSVGAVATARSATQQVGINGGRLGYDGPMSESSNETPEVGLIPDEDLPEDLQPEENPLARDPDEDGDDAGDGSPAGGSGGSAEGKVEGMPDMGEPGA